MNGRKRSTFDSVGKWDCNSSEGDVASDMTKSMAQRHWKEQLEERRIDRLQNNMISYVHRWAAWGFIQAVTNTSIHLLTSQSLWWIRLYAEITARLGRPTDQLMRQYMTPTTRWMSDTKLQEAVEVWVITRCNGWFWVKQVKASVFDLLWVGEVVVDLLVEDVEYDVEEVPAEVA